jgi:predicted Zn-dependent protease
MHNAYKAYIQAFDVAQNGNFKDAKVILAKALVEEPSNEVYGSRFLLNMALGQVALFGGNPAEAKSYLQKAVLLKKNTSYLLPWAYYYLARAGKETGDIDLMKYAIQKAIESESIIGKYIGAARMANDLQ